LHRVYEVEEHPGEIFMYQVLKEAKTHRNYETVKISGTYNDYGSKQGSLPAYVYGFKLAKMAEILQQVTFNEISEAGKIRFDKGELYGSTPVSNFYESEKDYFKWLMEEVFPIIK
jgi:hypothetical protein